MKSIYSDSLNAWFHDALALYKVNSMNLTKLTYANKVNIINLVKIEIIGFNKTIRKYVIHLKNTTNRI
jgi:hypothetical protein